MPTQMKPRKPKAERRKISVSLTDAERKELGLTLLGIKDGTRRQDVLADLVLTLGGFATHLGNADDVQLNSDFVAMTRPLVRAADRFEAKVRAAEMHVCALMEYKQYVALGTLFEQLEGFRGFLAWLKSDPSKRGGERRAFVKGEKVVCVHVLEKWFDRYSELADPKGVARARAQFTRKAMEAVERALRKAVSGQVNTGQKLPVLT